jgi:3-deoxy-D-manno-octulosonate 8-phosphate phosphatase (KDO 8-P phosphatase)
MRSKSEQDVAVSVFDRLQTIRVLILDVEGVLTDGHTWQDARGMYRHSFSVRDTMGIRALRKAGIKVAVLSSEFSSGNSSEIVQHLNFVGVDEARIGCKDKASELVHLKDQLGFDWPEVAYVTHDKAVSSLMTKVGCGISIVGAPAELASASCFVTARSGGDGAILEVCNLILQHSRIASESRAARAGWSKRQVYGRRTEEAS